MIFDNRLRLHRALSSTFEPFIVRIVVPFNNEKSNKKKINIFSLALIDRLSAHQGRKRSVMTGRFKTRAQDPSPTFRRRLLSSSTAVYVSSDNENDRVGRSGRRVVLLIKRDVSFYSSA